MQPGTLGPLVRLDVRRLAAGALALALAARPGAADAREAPVETASYVLRVALDPARHVLEGDGTIEFVNHAEVPVARLVLALPLNAFKNDASVFYRANGSGFRGAGTPRDWGALDVLAVAQEPLAPGAEGAPPARPLALVRHLDDPDDETTAAVDLAEPVPPGGRTRLAVRFATKLPSVVLRTGYDGSFHLAAQWFPKLAKTAPGGGFASEPMSRFAEFAADFGTYDVTVDVPAAFVVAAAGVREELPSAPGRTRARFVLRDVHDFAFAAWDGFVTAERRAGAVTVRGFAPRGHEAVLARELDAAAGALPFFADRFGAYPYPELVVVHPPAGAIEAGGMEYPALLTTGGSPLVPSFVRSPEILTVHELGHQWFYGVLASDERAYPFLDEGVNTYAEMLAMEARWGRASVGRAFGLEVGLPAVHAVLARRGAGLLPVASPARAFPHGRAYGALVYSRTGTILETFRRVHGEPALREVFARYTQAARFDHPTPDTLLAAFAAVLGPAAADTLRVALFEEGTVDFAVAKVRSSPRRGRAGIFDDATGRRTEAGLADGPGDFEGSVDLERRGRLAFPVDVEFVRADGVRERRVWAGDAPAGHLAYRGPSPLVGVVVDPEHKVLLQDRFDDDHATTPERRSFCARAFARLVAGAALVGSLLGP